MADRRAEFGDTAADLLLDGCSAEGSGGPVHEGGAARIVRT